MHYLKTKNHHKSAQLPGLTSILKTCNLKFDTVHPHNTLYYSF